jgi:hypothetical protein
MLTSGFDHFPTDPDLEEMTSNEPPGYLMFKYHLASQTKDSGYNNSTQY